MRLAKRVQLIGASIVAAVAVSTAGTAVAAPPPLVNQLGGIATTINTMAVEFANATGNKPNINPVEVAALADAYNRGDVKRMATLLKPSLAGDPFYWPASVGGAPGQLLRSRDVSVGVRQALGGVSGKATQYKFVSRDSHGGAISATATLVLPPGKAPGQVRNVYALQEATDSLSPDCSIGPKSQRGESYDNPTGVTAVAALQRGYAVLMADHDGPDAAYAATVQTGHIALDAMRLMSRQFPQMRFVSEGYSGGGLTTYAAGMLQNEYAPELNGKVLAYIAGGTPVDLEAVVRKMNGSRIGTGIAMAAILGISRQHHEAYGLLNENGVAMAYLMRNVCLTIFGLYGMLEKRLDEFAKPGAFDSPKAKAIYAYNYLPNGSRWVPANLYGYHSVGDQWIPYWQFLKWMNGQIQLGKQFVRQIITGSGEHSPYGVAERDRVVQIMVKEFNRK